MTTDEMDKIIEELEKTLNSQLKNKECTNNDVIDILIGFTVFKLIEFYEDQSKDIIKAAIYSYNNKIISTLNNFLLKS